MLPQGEEEEETGVVGLTLHCPPTFHLSTAGLTSAPAPRLPAE